MKDRTNLNVNQLWLVLAVLEVALCISLAGCLPDKEDSFIISVKQYHFQPGSFTNPEMLLAAMQPITGTKPMPLHQPESQPVSWNQSQFIGLIKALAQEEIQADDEIHTVYFAVSCDHVKFGPQALGIIFDRIGSFNNETTRLETDIQVDAQAGFIDLSVGGVRPVKAIAQVTELDKKIPAEQALALAEQSGGSERRKSLADNCTIGGSLLDNEWSIRYIPLATESRQFAIFLDATTGALVLQK